MALLFIVMSFFFGFANAASIAPINSSWIATPESQQPFLQVPNFVAGFFCFIDDSYFSVFKTNELYAAPAIWTANRNQPVFVNATLELDHTGNLVLRSDPKNIVWESKTSGRGVVGMELYGNGNLVLYNSRNKTIWQSFSSPTDILVPGQKLELGQSLKSSASIGGFNEGSFRLSVEVDRVSLGFSSGLSYGEWCSGYGQPIAYLAMHTDSLSCHQKDGSMITSIAFNDTNLILHLTAEGILRVTVVSPSGVKETKLDNWFLETRLNSPCEGPGACGEYGVCNQGIIGHGDCGCLTSFSSPVDSNNIRNGCRLDRPVVDCGASELVIMPGMLTLPEYITGYTMDDCKGLCLKNCSCKGVVYTQKGCVQMLEVFSLTKSPGLAQLYNMTVFLKTSLSSSIAETPHNTPKGLKLLQRKKGPTWTGFVIAAIIVTGAGVVVGVAIWKFYSARALIRSSTKTKALHVSGLPVNFEYEELCKMTSGFEKKIGHGGFSTVFEGVLHGTKVAVKRLESARQGLKQFEAEVKTIGSIEHRNLVKLQGYGADDHHYYLVYEFLSNLSLDKWLFRADNSETLDWKTRCRIAMDVARGLEYLHAGCNSQVLHLDIKPQNILLNTNFEAKICDFGLARLVNRSDDAEENFVNTIMRGTPGYMAPEWLHSRVSEKADVYSFGIVLLELVSGRKTLPLPSSFISFSEEGSDKKAKVMRTKDLEKSELLLSNVDPRLLNMPDFNAGEANDVVKIGLICVSGDHLCRPSMGIVVKMLEAAVLPN